MAKLPNTAAFTVSDGLNQYLNVDTVNGNVTLSNSNLDLTQSSTAPDPGAGGTLTTNDVSVVRISPAGAETGLILQPGSIAGQLCLVVNEAAVTNFIQFATSATSNVADGTNNILPGHHCRLLIWDSSTSLWYSVGQPTILGTTATVVSATAPDPGAGGTIATTGVGVALVNPVAARTGCILAAGTYPGQEIWVVNEAASANSITFAASGTSNVADGTSDVIAGVTARKFVWTNSLWYRAA